MRRGILHGQVRVDLLLEHWKRQLAYPVPAGGNAAQSARQVRPRSSGGSPLPGVPGGRLRHTVAELDTGVLTWRLHCDTGLILHQVQVLSW